MTGDRLPDWACEPESDCETIFYQQTVQHACRLTDFGGLLEDRTRWFRWLGGCWRWAD